MSAARRLVRELGAGAAALYVVHKGLQALSGGRMRLVPYVFYAQPLGRASGPALRPDPHTVLVELLHGDSRMADLPRPPDVLAARFAAGGRCHAAWVKGRFAGTIWLARGHYDEDEVRCRYVLGDPAVSAWDYDVYVDPAFRLGRTMARLWAHVDAELSAQGVRWSFSRISMFNAASIQSHARLGARPVGWAVFVAAGRWQWAVRPGFPWVSFSGRRQPTVVLQPPRDKTA